MAVLLSQASGTWDTGVPQQGGICTENEPRDLGLVFCCDCSKIPEGTNFTKGAFVWVHSFAGVSHWLTGPVVWISSEAGTSW